MNKRHKTNCPLCKHPEIEYIEQLYGDWHIPSELIGMFDLVGPGKTYENESAAYRGIERHMTASRKPIDRRAKNAIGLLRCFARNGAKAIGKADPSVLLPAGQRAAAKLGEITVGTKHHIEAQLGFPDVRSLTNKQLESTIEATAKSISGKRQSSASDSHQQADL